MLLSSTVPVVWLCLDMAVSYEKDGQEGARNHWHLGRIQGLKKKLRIEISTTRSTALKIHMASYGTKGTRENHHTVVLVAT